MALKRTVFGTVVFSIVAWGASSGECPEGMFRTMLGYGKKPVCVPYGQGSPSNPPPIPRQSDISGPSAPGSGESAGTVKPAK